MTAASFFTALAGVIAVIGLAVFLYGIPPELKRKMERSALKTMGENKLSYVAKDQINKIPTSDQTDPLQLKKGVSNLAGGAAQNPLGEATVRAASNVWDTMQTNASSARDTVQAYSSGALERVKTFKGVPKQTAEVAQQKAEETQ